MEDYCSPLQWCSANLENDILAPHNLHDLRLVFILPDMTGVVAGFGVLSAYFLVSR